MSWRLERIFVVLAAVLVACSLTAVILQDHTSALPLGLLNQNPRTYELISRASLIVTLGALAVFAHELARARPSRVGRVLRGLMFSFAIFEAGVRTFDRFDSRPGMRSDLRTSAGERLLFLHPNAQSPLGFRTPSPYVKEPAVPRILFIGDSFTEGNGTAAECNYPTVAERTLAAIWGRPIEVMNAGVRSTGPAEAATRLRFLVEQGFAFDAIVHQLYLGNDFTDNLPGTFRVAQLGLAERYPTSWFLRTFHPVNTRTFRRARMLRVVLGVWARDDAAGEREPVGCNLQPERPVAFSNAFIEPERWRLEANYRRDGARVALSLVQAALDDMRATAARLGVPFILVVIPDRFLVDPRLATALGLPSPDHDLSTLSSWVPKAVPGTPIIDLTPVLDAHGEYYKPQELHWNDLGNVRAGEHVGERLAVLLDALRVSEPRSASGHDDGAGAAHD